MHFACDIQEDAVAKVHCIVQTEEKAAESMTAGEVLEDALSPQTGLRILSNRSRGIGLARAAARNIAQRINVTRGEYDYSTAEEPIRYDRGNQRIHRPSQLGMAGRAELPAGQVQNIGAVGQLGNGVAVHQVTCDGFDSRFLNALARNRDD